MIDGPKRRTKPDDDSRLWPGRLFSRFAGRSLSSRASISDFVADFEGGIRCFLNKAGLGTYRVIYKTLVLVVMSEIFYDGSWIGGCLCEGLNK